MGLLIKHVSGVLLMSVGILVLSDNHCADAAQTPDPFVDLNFFSLRHPEIIRTPIPPSGVGSGRILYSAPIRLKENATGPVFSFSTKFGVLIYLEKHRARQLGYGGSARNAVEGFTFAMLPHPNASLGGNGGYLGLLNATSNGDPQSHTFAIEVDFVNSPQFSDPDGGYHIGINVNSMNSTSWAIQQGPKDDENPNYWVLEVWVDYDASVQILNVTTADIGKLSCPLGDGDRPEPEMLEYNDTTTMPSNFLSQEIDLSDVLNEYMYVGFTYSTSRAVRPVLVGSFVLDVWSFRTSNFTSPPAHSAPFKCVPFAPPSFYALHRFEVRLSVILLSLATMAVLYALLYKRYSGWVERRGWRFNIDADGLEDSGPHKFTYKELALATKNFDPKQALGRGGFGSVYKGFLPGNKQDVAVKRVAPDSSQGEREFMAEVIIIGKIRHRNLVRLQGWCHERGELLLVYDFMPRGSLDKLLFRSRTELTIAGDEEAVAHSAAVVDGREVVGFPWERRFKVVGDVATALVYLHTECEERIIHRDVKAANVMLDAKFNARLGDFGLARSYNHSLLTPESTNVAGTFGYLAPELFHTGKQTEQTDVYSFGALLLEVACGKKPIYHEDGESVVLVEQVWMLWGSSRILDVADPRLAGLYNDQEMTTVLCLALLCSHPSPAMRPSMHQVLLVLNGDVPLPDVPLSRPRFDFSPRISSDILSWNSDPSSTYFTASTQSEETPMNRT